MRTIGAAGLTMLLLVGAAQAANVQVITLPTNDITYDGGTGRIYATVPARAGATGNSIAVIDPVTRAVGPFLPVGPEPNQLSPSDNGQFIYVGIDGAGAVGRFDIALQAIGLQFALGSHPSFGLKQASDLRAVPGNPGAVAVAMRYALTFPAFAGLAIFDNGVARPAGIGEFSVSGEQIETLAFSTSPGLLFGATIVANPQKLYGLAVGASGVAITSETPGLVTFYGLDLVFQNGLIFASSGQVVNPAVPQVQGTIQGLQAGALVRPDLAAGRIYVLTGTAPAVFNRLNTYDSASLQLIGSASVPGVSGVPTSLIRWGADGLAFRTSADQVVIITEPSVGGSGATVESFIGGLYIGVLGRAASQPEIDAWVAFLRADPSPASVSAMAHTFLDGPEFLSRPFTPATFVTLLYEVFLGRGPDGPGLASWVDVLLDGFNTALPGFVNSPEFRARVPDLSNRPAVTAVVERLYDEVLDRVPAASEVTAWVDYIVATGDLLGVAEGFFASAEYNGRARTLSQHVVILYRTFLNRDPAPSEIPQWTNYLQTFRTQVEDSFVNSQEFFGRLSQFDLAPRGTAPVIAGLSVSPPSVPRSAGIVTITASVNFSDPDADVALLHITAPSLGISLDFPVSPGTTTGTLSATVQAFTIQSGTTAVIVQAFDRRGNSSNSLSGQFTITGP